MIIKLDMNSDTPIYMQLRNQIVLGIGSGDLKIGESLPTVRQMAQEIGINTMTVNKTYTLLKNEGFIQIDRRHGAKVSQVAPYNGNYSEQLEQELKLLITKANMCGYTNKEIVDICTKITEKINIKKVLVQL